MTTKLEAQLAANGLAPDHVTEAAPALLYLPAGRVIAAKREPYSLRAQSRSLTGYGPKIPTDRMVTLDDRRPRRVYVRNYGNSGTAYVLIGGQEWIVGPDAEAEIETLTGLGFPYVDAYKLDPFTRQYLETALWSSYDESTPEGGEPMDSNYGIDDFAPEALAQAVLDCARFQRENAGDLAACYAADVFIQGERYNPSNAGHDFWLTRCGHGTGFWDRGLGEAGDRLADICREDWGNVDPYIGDSGRVFFG